MGQDGLADDYLASNRGWLMALRGDAATAGTLLADLRDLRASEDLQDKSLISVVEAFTAAARRQPEDALSHARAALAHAEALGISFETLRWAWPLAARAAFELGATTRELIAMLDSYQPGHVAVMLRAERDLARASLADSDGDQTVASSLRCRDHRAARALYALPPRPRPARPRRIPHPPGRCRSRRPGHRGSPHHR